MSDTKAIDLRLLDLPEERIEIPDPLLDGKAARIGTEESTGLRWKRGGFVRVVFVRFKYSTATPATVEPSTDASDHRTVGTRQWRPRVMLRRPARSGHHLRARALRSPMAPHPQRPLRSSR